ncbi:MAG TPA: glycoside hydrolase family 97 N-terminal domain-containing protein, partial [Ferruginibacter sp.]|nr:glycoside hydrolase family 97 N-terminal domain-containing protein [Ferruginibacter sp.]
MQLKKISIVIFLLILIQPAIAQNPITIHSPNNHVTADFWINNSGEPLYSITYKNKKVVLPSTLGFDFKL